MRTCRLVYHSDKHSSHYCKDILCRLGLQGSSPVGLPGSQLCSYIPTPRLRRVEVPSVLLLGIVLHIEGLLWVGHFTAFPHTVFRSNLFGCNPCFLDEDTEVTIRLKTSMVHVWNCKVCAAVVSNSVTEESVWESGRPGPKSLSYVSTPSYAQHQQMLVLHIEKTAHWSSVT